MLQAASPRVKYCYEQALEAERLATKARNLEDRRLYLDNAKRWFGLAASYEHPEQLQAFLKELRGSTRKRSVFGSGEH